MIIIIKYIYICTQQDTLLFFCVHILVPAGITEHAHKKIVKGTLFLSSLILVIYLFFLFFCFVIFLSCFFHPLIRVAYGPHLPWWPPCGALDIVKTSQTIIALRNLLGRLTTKFRSPLSFSKGKNNWIFHHHETAIRRAKQKREMQRYKGENAVWLLRGPQQTKKEELAKSRRETRNDCVRIPASKQSAFT